VMRAHRYQRKLTLIVFDLDDFKSINDQVGHLAGDRVLAQAADRLREAVRSVDVASRIGGDEFAVIMPESSAGRAAPAALGRHRRAPPRRHACEPLRTSGRRALPGEGAREGSLRRRPSRRASTGLRPTKHRVATGAPSAVGYPRAATRPLRAAFPTGRSTETATLEPGLTGAERNAARSVPTNCAARAGARPGVRIQAR
jgi:hypothetical protein